MTILIVALYAIALAQLIAVMVFAILAARAFASLDSEPDDEEDRT